jgi:hypothetical protein
MTKVITVFVCAFLCSCVEYAESAGAQSAIVNVNPNKWFLGTWDCPSKFYRDRPPFYKQHTVDGVLVFTDVSDTDVDVTWTETFVSGFESRTVDFAGRITVSPPNANGVSGASIRIVDTDGATFEGTGRSQGVFRDFPTLLGVLSFHPFESGGAGVFTFPEHARRLMNFNMFGNRGVGGAPDQTTFGRGMETAPGSGSIGDYFPATRCFRRPQ